MFSPRRLLFVLVAVTSEASTLDRRPIENVITAHETETFACYDAARASYPKVERKVTVRFTIGPNGHVSDVSVDLCPHQEACDPSAPAFVECLTAAVQAWTFPLPPIEPREYGGNGERQPIVVTYPFNFEVHASDAGPEPTCCRVCSSRSQPCGDTCIAKNKVCHVGKVAPAAVKGSDDAINDPARSPAVSY
jgi:hypothetical protein